MMHDVVIVGGGFSGTIAAIVLARAGWQVALVDRHLVYPPDFRAEHLHGEQAETLRRLGVLDEVVAGVPPVRQVADARRGRLCGVRPTLNYGMRYETMVNTARALLPAEVEKLFGRVEDLRAGAERQTVLLADGSVASGRLLVLATGLGYTLNGRLGIGRRVLHEGHSLSFGFDMAPLSGGRFPYPFLAYPGERAADGIDYLSAFEIGEAMRANLFTFRAYRDAWTQAMRREPERTLAEALPGLAKVLGPYRVTSPVQARAMDLYQSENYRIPGVVLIGDAFQTACPPAGAGLTRALIDVERLCTVHVPDWLATPGMGVEKIAAFYDDPVKRASDARATHDAHYRRALSTETSLGWTLHRWRLRVQGWLPDLGSRLRPQQQPA